MVSIPAIPSVLIVDDEPDTQRGRALELQAEVNVAVAHPEHLTSEQLGRADLVLVDLRLTEWPLRDALSSITLQPLNGLALSAVLRSHAFVEESRSPIAFALHSGHLADIAGGLPPDTREHVVARANNLEWAFEKVPSDRTVPPLSARIVSLASAVHRLPTSWTEKGVEAASSTATTLLGLVGDETWEDRARQDVEECHPPLHELSQASHGLAFLRWLLHRIIPYPCFLMDTHALAARLRSTLESVEGALLNIEALDSLLAPYRYRGVLENFSGTRWWRAGVEALLWEISSGRSFDQDALQAGLKSRSVSDLEGISTERPVVCIDQNYRKMDEIYDAESAVRVQPDDWPPYADQAWTTIELALGEPAVRALVIGLDQERVDNYEPPSTGRVAG